MSESVAMDHLDTLAAEAFPGYLVRKDLVRRYARQYPVPTYVVEFLLGRYCASVDDREIEEGLAIVERQLRGRTVRTSDQEIFKSRARENGSVKLIDVVRAKLDAKNDCYVAELPSLNLNDVQVSDGIVKDNERMLGDGFYAEVTLGYDPVESQDAVGPPVPHRAVAPHPDVAAGRARRAGPRPPGVHDRAVARLARPLRGSGAGRPGRGGQARRAAAHGGVRRAQLQPGRARPARHRQEPHLPAALPVLAPAVGRQGHRGEDVREHGEWAARPGLPVRRGLLRRDRRHLVRSEGRREHHEGLHGLRRVQPRQGEHPRRGRHRHGRQLRRGRRAAAADRSSPEPAAEGDAGRHGVPRPHPRLRARLELPEAQPRRSPDRPFRTGERLPQRVLDPPAADQPGLGAPEPRVLGRCPERTRRGGRAQDLLRPREAALPRSGPARAGRRPRMDRAAGPGVAPAREGAAEAVPEERVPQHALLLHAGRRRRRAVRLDARSCTATKPSTATRCRPARSGRSAPAGARPGRASIASRSPPVPAAARRC